MDLFEIKAPCDWTADKDIEEFESRFDLTDNVQLRAIEEVERSYEEQITALIKALRYYLDKTSAPLRIPVEALSIPEMCVFIRECVQKSGREPEYVERFGEHLDAILHYDVQRAKVLVRHWRNPDQAWLLELADVADTIATASIEFDEAMCCEHDDYESAIV
ncbi:MAG: hypothetical protein ACO1QS_19085 [Verrucomicrobiota bacterium]